MVRRIRLPGTGIETSVLGFGCASLGSRISRAQGLRSLDEAYASGVTWYDVAPPYGAGAAELIIGAFIKGRRDTVQLCTKVGLTHPHRNLLMKAVYATARPVVGRLKSLRRGFRSLPSTRYRRVLLDAATITASLDRSLLRLGTDRVEVFALHDPNVVDLSRDETLRALEDILRAGKALHVSVAGTFEACQAGISASRLFAVAQLADPPGSDALAQIRRAAGRPLTTVSHSVFGVAGVHERLVHRLSTDAEAAIRLAQAGYDGPPAQAAGALLMDRALAANAEGVVLASMFSASHRKLNIDRASRPLSTTAENMLQSLEEAGRPGAEPA